MLKKKETLSLKQKILIVKVIIHDRLTFPTREDIVGACKLLFIQGELNRKRDLQWLSSPNKKVSSIVFRIVGEITKPYSRIVWKNNEPILFYKH